MTTASTPEKRSTASVAHNVGWAAISQVWSIALSLVSTMILARVLTPDDYGVLAAASPLIYIAAHLQALGFPTAIIQAKTINKRQLDALFWVSFGLSILLSTTLILAAPSLARLLDDPRLQNVLIIGAVAIVVMALASQPTAILSRQLRFRAISLRNMFSTAIATTTTIVIAVTTHSYWALIIGIILVPLLDFVTSVGLTNWRPGLPRRDAKAGTLLRFGFSIWSSNLFNFTARNSDNLIVAYATSPRDLGLYDRAYRLLLYPINQAILPLGRVIMPTLSRNLDNPERYRSLYWRAVTLLLLLCQPGLVVAIVFPTTVIALLLGPHWLDGAEIFGWFGAAGLFQIFLGTTQWLLVSQGRGRELMHINLVNMIIALISFVIGIQWGIRGLTIAYVLGQGLICAPFNLWIVGRSGIVHHAELFRRLLPHGLALALAMLLVLTSRLLFGSPLWPMLITTTVLAYASYCGVLAVTPASRDLLLSLMKRISHGIDSRRAKLR